MAKLLLEVFSEEIPARMQPRAAEDLKRLVVERLDAARLTHDAASAYVTPRRLTLIVTGLPKAQPDITVEKKGPRVGAPQAAIEGFLRSVGLDSADECEQRDTGKGVFYYAVSHEKGRPTEEALSGLLADALDALLWPKSMRWGRHKLRWVRPVHSILCLFDGRTIPFRFAHLTAGDTTCGHRHLAPERFAVTGVADYKAKLRSAHVVLDAEARMASIRRQLDHLAAAEGLRVAPDEALIAENAGLVEWPVVLLGRIDEAFLDVPREVLTTAMRTHQKYFSLEKADGSFAPRFALVSNMVTADGGAAIVAGNERVLRARLADAKFFWDQDRAHTLESRVPRLADIVFHAKLGTLEQKVSRVTAAARRLSRYVPLAQPELAERAAWLCKADLVTKMVGEFPELQGIMGRYYARHDGEAEAVAAAIAEHYSPLGPGDRCPTDPVSVVVSLADKIDTLVGFFAIGEAPTGSKDPYALRRAALGVIRLILENRLRVPLLDEIDAALGVYDGQGMSLGGKGDPIGVALLSFFADRLKVHLREQGIGHDLISAIFAERGEALEDDLLRLTEKAHRLAAFLKSDDGANLLVAYRRASNIVRAEQKKGWVANGNSVDRALFRQPEEHALYEALGRVRGIDLGVIEAGAFEGYLQDLAGLRRPVDAFFDKVTVNAEDAALRDNRLKFMQAIGAKMDAIADFSKIEG